jgi:molybdopterin/thiamine biosynthesis adenylyltransferase
VLPGIIGTIQAAEALAFILGTDEPSAGQLLTVELMPLRFRQVPLRRTPDCPACGRLP